MLLSLQTKAQHDSNYVDSISMHHFDTIVTLENNSTGYKDEDDGYVDTTIKHIYDTSKYFFNWKSYYNDAFVKDKIVPRHLLDSAVNALKQDDAFWYIPAIEKIETRLKNDPSFRDSLMKVRNHSLSDQRPLPFWMQAWFNIMVWVLAIAIFIAALIYFLVQNKISIFSRDAAVAGNDNSEEEAEDIFNISYTRFIQKAEKENDFRVAIRLMFLQTLKVLSDTGNIQYQPDYTDLHYLQQLHETKYYSDFFKVMRSYEYAWYGKFFIAPEHYAIIKKDFNQLQNRIR